VRAGLNAKPEKTELMFFKKRRERIEPPAYIHLPLPTLNTYYRVQTANKLRYLSFHIDARLNWKHHVDIMCNRARRARFNQGAPIAR
jgi:hypothetical protein